MEERIAGAEAADVEAAGVHAEMSERRKAQRAADKAGRKVIMACRLRLTVLFGTAWNAQWMAGGFPDGKTMVPKRHGQRQTLLNSLAGYFKANPEHESADMGATEAVCRAAFEALSDARSAVNAQKAARGTAVKKKRGGWKALRKAMRGLIRELTQLLPPEDGRWRRFGLKLPARKVMPDAVARVRLTVLGHGFVHAHWPAAPRATRYRVQTRFDGAGEFMDADTVHGTEKLLAGLPQDARLEVRIIAANESDEAQPSPAAAVQVV